MEISNSRGIFQNSWSAGHFQIGLRIQETCKGLGIIGTSESHLSQCAAQSWVVAEGRLSGVTSLVGPWKPQEWIFHPISALKLNLSLQLVYLYACLNCGIALYSG